MKRVLALILTLALFVTLLPTFASTQTASAAGAYFLFPNENDTRANARVVSTKTIQLDGTLNGVVGSSISYKIEQIPATGLEDPLNQTEDITTGISVAGDNRMTVSSVILFPGMNKITFKGVAGASVVSEAIYIEYRDNPMLYDMKVTFENRDHDLLETAPTMLYSSSPVIQQQGQIVITGRAPNATKVTIDINGRTYDFNVSTGANNRFSTSQLTIDKGINNIKFKVHNGGQIVETTRQIAFYNGEVTYYNLKIKDTPVDPSDTKIAEFTNNMDFLTNQGTSGLSGIQIQGTAIIPLPLHDLEGNSSDTIPTTDPVAFKAALVNMLSLQIMNNNNPVTVDPVAANVSYLPATIDSTTKFITVSFSYTLPHSSATHLLAFDVRQSIRFKAPNLTSYNESSWINFTIRDGSKAYIQDINYLTGFDSSMTTNASTENTSTAKDMTRILGLQSTDIPVAGTDVYSIPMGIELLIGNHTSIPDINALVAGLLVNSGPTPDNFVYKLIMRTDDSAPLSQIVNRTINNEQVSLLRVFVEVQKLPKSGSNTIQFKFDASMHDDATAETKSITARLLYGPYMKFNSIVDGMSKKYDTVSGTAASLLALLGDFKGQLYNVVNDAEIVYAAPGQTVFMYLNNVEIPLQKLSGTDTAKTQFEPVDIGDVATKENISKIINKAGDNTIKFVFASASNNYEYTLKFSIVPENLPTIPAENTDGVYPYTMGQWPPVANDPSFTKQGSVFTTREAEFDVHGTFDFIDLGTTQNDVFINDGSDNPIDLADPENYVIEINSPNWSKSIQWSLENEFMMTEDSRRNLIEVGGVPVVVNKGQAVVTPDASLSVYYNLKDQNFFFNIANQSMPADGSSVVYVITVFNAGVTGPRATYRLEINPISIPYSIKSPVREELVTNRNFVEVIISSPGADSMIIGKEKAEKVTFKDHGSNASGNGGDITYVEAFRAVVKDLRAGRETKIPFQITRGEDTIKQELVVKYVPTNIPGAQMMETLSTSHKMFNSTLTLTFTKNTQLIRPNYNDSNAQSTQVYNDNDILFAIANPNDGIVDRHLYEGQPPNYSANSQAAGNLHIGYRFQDEARQFIKASPLYWIDAGLADGPDPNLPGSSRITTGLDPFPFPNLLNKYEGNFASRWGQYDRELVPSSPGKLTLTYDSSVVQSAGTTITVFRFDPYNSKWENIGGVVDEKKHTVTVPFSKFGYYVAVKLTRGFNDITDHPYAREAMEAIFSKGIMNAIDPIGMFGGDRYVTRGEFTRMIVRALDLPLNYEGDMHFTYYPETITNANQSSSIYDYRYIETAARAGIVNGKRPGFFDEDVELTRQEGAVILARALQLKLEPDSTKAKNALDKVFKDSGSFDFYSIPSVLAIEKKGFIQGKLINPDNPKEGSVFEPRARLLRSDAAIIMARVMNDMKKLPKIYN